MPSPAEPRSLCLIGDSQMGSASLAIREGLTAPPDGHSLEFWGATGPAFRTIDWVDGAIRPAETARAQVLQINGHGRDHVAPGDFNGVIFYGARLRIATFFAAYFQWRSERLTHPSRAVLETAVHDFAISTRAYRLARHLAAAGDPVFYIPAPFTSDGVRNLTRAGNVFHSFPAARNATTDDRAFLWEAFETVSARDGITLIRQPEDTVTSGVLTKAKYQCADAVALDDIGHKSPAFAARWLQDLWPKLGSCAQAA
ncbi:MAG: hypothetical protein AAFQ59_19675 [Pseudomonadota bacterium]